MPRPIRVRATVQPDGRIELRAPELSPGQAVDVTIQPTNGTPRRSILDVLAECPGGLIFRSADEVDEYIRSERQVGDR